MTPRLAAMVTLSISVLLSQPREVYAPGGDVSAVCVAARAAVYEGEPLAVDVQFDNASGFGLRYGVALEWQTRCPAGNRWEGAGRLGPKEQVSVRLGRSVYGMPDTTAALQRDPGKWRVRAVCGPSDDPLAVRLKAEQCIATDWVFVTILPHAGNRALLTGARGETAQEAMRNALSGTEPWTTDQLVALLELRAQEVSPRIAARAELVAARPAMRRLAGSSSGPREHAEAKELRKVILRAGEGIGEEPGHWGGLRGEFFEERFMVESILDTPERHSVAEQIRLDYPGRYEGLEQRWRDMRAKARQRYL